jgi:hypothetical protein
MDLTKEVLRYRECARHVWNAYFQPMPDGWHGWHEFFPVDKALFDALVLAQFERRAGLWEKHPEGYFDAVAVVPVAAPSGLPAMFVRPESGSENRWAETRLDGSVEMKFIEFFDFANYNDPRDLKWVRARVVGPAGHLLLGADVLLEPENVRFEGIT